MHILLIHTETIYFAGAQKMLGYFLRQEAYDSCRFTLAMAENQRLEESLPSSVRILRLPSNQFSSLFGLLKQIQVLRPFIREEGVSAIHAWTARDWETAAMAGRFAGCRSVGTLHDHPRASFISSKRQRLMKIVAQYGLQKVICVSDAVREACLESGFPARKLERVHNGLPAAPMPLEREPSGPRKLGFLAAFSERKGLRGFFAILDELFNRRPDGWEAIVAGGAQDEDGEKLEAELRVEYSKAPWWPRVSWVGWAKDPMKFLGEMDVLICPSSEFDPFPTVLLEAGLAGIPVVAAQVGGVQEIVQHGKSGWTFPARDWQKAALEIDAFICRPETGSVLGKQARMLVENEFSLRKMIMEYKRIYGSVRRYV